MLRVTVISSWTGRGTRQAFVARDGMTGRELARLYGQELGECLVATPGRPLWGHTLDEELHDTDVIVGPDIGLFVLPEAMPFIWKALFQVGSFIAVSLTFHAVYRALFPAPDLPVDRGDDRSPTYSWSGIGTSYGAGFRVPLVYGRHRVGGQVVSTSVVSLPGNPNADLLRTLLVLGEGPFHSIGGIRLDRDDMGEIPTPFGWSTWLGEFPAGVQVNGNLITPDVAILGVRMGNVYQAPIRGFDDARNSVAVNGQLDDELSEQVAVVPTPLANRIGVRLSFPGGLYKQTGGGNYSGHRVEFDLQWRSHAQTAWSAPRRLVVAPATPRRTEFSVWFWQAVAAPTGLSAHDGFDVRVTRITRAGAAVAPTTELWVDSCLLLDVDYVVDQFFAYPRRALLSIVLRANEKLQGGQPQYSIPIEGRRIRVWDEAVGWSSARYWALPAAGDEAGDPFVGIWTHDPGRNPAWICADLLTSDIGLGAAFALGDLDAEAFRRWADHCDLVSADSDALLTCDLVIDQGEDAWDVALRVARAGRAALVISGRTIKPVYEFRDAHGRGTVVVPARSRVSIVGTSNVEDFELQYLPVRRRPNLLEAQFLNADLEYEQDALPVEDPAAEINDPTLAVPDEVRRESVEYFGVTNPLQVRREILLRHNLNRLMRKAIRFKCGIDQLAVEVGDVVGVQHDAIAPWGLRETYFSCRTARASTAVREIVLDRDLVISTGTRSVCVQLLGAVGSADLWGSWVIDLGNGSYAAGTVLPTLAVQPTVDCDAGTIAVVGEFEGNPASPADEDARGVEDYRVVSATLGDDLRREIQAVLWTPDAFTIPAVDAGTSVPMGEDLGPTPSIEQVTSVQLTRDAAPGRFRIAWAMPDGHRAKRARVFVRRSTAEPRELLGEVVGDQLITELDPDAPLLVAVCPEDDEGTFLAPDEADEVALTPPEWRVTDFDAVSGLVAQNVPEGIELSWSPLRSSEIVAYEVRVGTHWPGAPVLARVRESRVLIRDLPAGDHTLHVRALYAGGIYSWVTASVVATRSLPAGTVELYVDAFDAGDGTHSQTDIADGVAIAAGKLEATWTLETAAELLEECEPLWAISLDTVEEQPGFSGADWTWPGSDPESFWMTGLAREASRRKPGCADFDLSGSEHTEAGATWLDPGSGPAGAVGANSRALIEIAFDGGAWETYVPQRRRATSIDVRVRLARVSLDFQRRVRSLSVQVTT